MLFMTIFNHFKCQISLNVTNECKITILPKRIEVRLNLDYFYYPLNGWSKYYPKHWVGLESIRGNKMGTLQAVIILSVLRSTITENMPKRRCLLCANCCNQPRQKINFILSSGSENEVFLPVLDDDDDENSGLSHAT